MENPDILAAAMADKAVTVADFLKGLASPPRLMILCCLLDGERSVGAITEATGIAQTSVSQHLARLREAGIVAFRRDHRTLHYRIADPAAVAVMQTLYAHFCAGGADARPGPREA